MLQDLYSTKEGNVRQFSKIAQLQVPSRDSIMSGSCLQKMFLSTLNIGEWSLRDWTLLLLSYAVALHCQSSQPLP